MPKIEDIFKKTKNFNLDNFHYIFCRVYREREAMKAVDAVKEKEAAKKAKAKMKKTTAKKKKTASSSKKKTTTKKKANTTNQ